MKRDIFRRGPRFQHQFGSLEEVNGPFCGPGTFAFDPPVAISKLSEPGAMPPMEIQQHGERMYSEPRSAVTKPSGSNASINGPAPDLAQLIGMPIPVGTKRRIGPPKTDK